MSEADTQPDTMHKIEAVLSGESDGSIVTGDCLEILPTLPDGCVDAIVTDPPYGLKFMGKSWDHGVPGEPFWREALRVAKPGCHLLAFGGTRTFHRLACAIEDAGWELRDCVMWVYGSGFPKSHDVSKAINKAAGAERERRLAYPSSVVGSCYAQDAWTKANRGTRLVNDAITPEAAEWNGWGTALKPAWEPILVARKPLEGTVAENVLAHGCGGINIDGCRVGKSKNVPGSDIITADSWLKKHGHGSGYGPRTREQSGMDPNIGRWPANLIHDGSDEVVRLFPVNVKGGTWNRTAGAWHFNNDGEPAESQTSGSDASTGSAARFFYCAKASKRDRDEGLEDIEGGDKYGPAGQWGSHDCFSGKSGDEAWKAKHPNLPKRNRHPTVKPTDLMRYLCRLVTPPGGLVLDPFCGSGSTGKAAILEGFRFVGIDSDEESCEIARKRITWVGKHGRDEKPLFAEHTESVASDTPASLWSESKSKKGG